MSYHFSVFLTPVSTKHKKLTVGWNSSHDLMGVLTDPTPRLNRVDGVVEMPQVVLPRRQGNRTPPRPAAVGPPLVGASQGFYLKKRMISYIAFGGAILSQGMSFKGRKKVWELWKKRCSPSKLGEGFAKYEAVSRLRFLGISWSVSPPLSLAFLDPPYWIQHTCALNCSWNVHTNHGVPWSKRWWLAGGFPFSKNKSIFILNFQLVICVYRNAESVFVANYNCLKSNCLLECLASFSFVFSCLYRCLGIFPRNFFSSPSIILSSHCPPQSVSLILLGDKKPCVRHLVPPATWTHKCFWGGGINIAQLNTKTLNTLKPSNHTKWSNVSNVRFGKKNKKIIFTHTVQHPTIWLLHFHFGGFFWPDLGVTCIMHTIT